MGPKVVKMTTRMGPKPTDIPARIGEKSGFEVASGRLGIAVFSRPLLEKEMRRLRGDREAGGPPGVGGPEANRPRASFAVLTVWWPSARDRDAAHYPGPDAQS